MTGSSAQGASPSRPIALPSGTLGFFPLRELAAELEARDEYGRSGVSGITLVRDENLTLMLVALREGAVMREHRAPSAGGVVLLSGRASFVAGDEGSETELATGSLAVFSADMPHAVRAQENARYLVIIGGRPRPHESAPSGDATEGRRTSEAGH